MVVLSFVKYGNIHNAINFTFSIHCDAYLHIFYGLLHTFSSGPLRFCQQKHFSSLSPFQIIPLESLLEYRESGRSEPLRSLAMSVHAQCRRVIMHNVIGRTLTGFGPAATAQDKVLQSEVTSFQL